MPESPPTDKRWDTHEFNRNRRHRLRHSSRGAQSEGAAPIPVRPLAGHHRATRHARAELDRLSRQFPADLAAGLAHSGQAGGVGPRSATYPGSGSLPHLHRHSQLPVWRSTFIQRGHGRRLRQGGQRLDGRGMAGQGASAARVHRRAGAEPRDGGGRNQPRRRRQTLRAGLDAGDGRHAAGQAPLLADLRRRRKTGPAHRHPRRQRVSPCRHPHRLAVVLYRGLRRPGRRLPAVPVVADLRGRVHQVPGAKGRTARIRLHLAAGAPLAADQILARPADGGPLGGPSTRRDCAGQRSVDDPALRRPADRGNVPEADGTHG